MQIRVWHLLSIIIVGAMTAFGPVRSMDWSWTSTQFESVKTALSSWTTLFKSGQDAATSSKPVVQEVALTPASAEAPPAAAGKAGKPATAEPAPVAAAPEVQAVAETPAPIVETAPAVKKTAVRSRRRRQPKSAVAGKTRRSRSNKAVAASAAAPVKEAVAAPVTKAAESSDPMIGTYVSLQLKSGREVKGVYQGKTATKIKIELPGMGPFEYDAANVAAIKPAE